MAIHSGIHWIRLKLYQWGRASRVSGGGYPTMSTTEKARIGRGGVFQGPNLPDDLAEVDRVIATAPPQHKLILVEIYTKEGDYRAHAVRLRLSVDAYYRRKNLAEKHVYAMLSDANAGVVLRANPH
jgi:hypothetical protein